MKSTGHLFSANQARLVIAALVTVFVATQAQAHFHMERREIDIAIKAACGNADLAYREGRLERKEAYRDVRGWTRPSDDQRFTSFQASRANKIGRISEKREARPGVYPGLPGDDLAGVKNAYTKAIRTAFRTRDAAEKERFFTRAYDVRAAKPFERDNWQINRGDRQADERAITGKDFSYRTAEADRSATSKYEARQKTTVARERFRKMERIDGTRGRYDDRAREMGAHNDAHVIAESREKTDRIPAQDKDSVSNSEWWDSLYKKVRELSGTASVNMDGVLSEKGTHSRPFAREGRDRRSSSNVGLELRSRKQTIKTAVDRLAKSEEAQPHPNGFGLRPVTPTSRPDRSELSRSLFAFDRNNLFTSRIGGTWDEKYTGSPRIADAKTSVTRGAGPPLAHMQRGAEAVRCKSSASGGRSGKDGQERRTFLADYRVDLSARDSRTSRLVDGQVCRL
ncbi:MAG TPA: hypothetical protein VKA60_10085 [Blastocatellia bacterium]|nr:hypothetical protein [Blastocatellia bacterium]